jgi:hypothetical protein
MKTLQNQYNLIKEGKGHKDVFLKEAKRIYPNLIPNSATFDQTTKILKQKSIISESFLGMSTSTGFSNKTPNWFEIFKENIVEAKEAKVEEKETTKEVDETKTKNFDYTDTKNIDNLYGEEFLKGYYTEMKDPKNLEKTVEELKEIVTKNLAKDRLHYVKDGQFGVKGLGYTNEHPGLGKTKEVTGKYKSSGMELVKLNESNLGHNEITEGYGMSLEDAKAEAKRISREEGVTQHVEETEEGSGKYRVSDWYDSDLTVASYENGINISENKTTNNVDKSIRGSITGPEWDSMDVESRSKLLKSLFPKLSLKFIDWNWNDLTPMIKNKLTGKVAKEYTNESINKTTNMIKLADLLEGEYYDLSKKEKKEKKEEKKPTKEVKKSPVADKIKEIEHQGSIAAMEAKMTALDEEIQTRESKLSMVKENEDLQEFINPTRINEMEKEIKELVKAKEKYSKMYEKMAGGKKKEVIDEEEDEEI